MLITYPARPVNGGPFNLARPKPGGQWFYEPKYNGWRALIHLPTGTCFNRHGQPLTIAAEFTEALALLRATLDCVGFKWADCEALERRHQIGRGTLILLDVVPEPQFANATYSDRRAWLYKIVPELHPTTRPEENTIYQSPRIAVDYVTPWWNRLQEINRLWHAEFYEGLVAKRAESPYPIQLRNPKEETSDWIKHRWAY